MKRLLILLLVGAVLSAPTSNESRDSKESTESKENEKLTVNKDFFPNEFVVYTAEHDIIQILMPLNALNFADDADEVEDEDRSTVFFVEAEDNNGVREYKGISVLNHGVATKLLETGTDVTAANDDTKTAYFAATDGLYSYNYKENTAERYGSITDNIIGIAKANGSDVIYILTKENELFKVTEEGTKKVKVDDVVGAKQIVLDYSNNLYYYGADNKPYVVSEKGVKNIEGLPDSLEEVTLIKPPFTIDDGVPFIANNKAYIIYANGTSELTDFEFEVKPSAYSMEATLIQYFGYKKKIYEYNVLAIVLGEIIEELKNYFTDKVNEIQSLATRPRNNLHL